MSEPAEVKQIQSDEVYRSMGVGIFAGLIAAGMSHWVLGKPNGLILVFVYGMSLYKQHGWMELSALLSMIGTVVAYFAVYESFKLDSSLVGSLGLSALAISLFAFYLIGAASWTVKARAKALASKNSISIDEAMVLPVRQAESWLEPRFAAMRAKKATGRLSMFTVARPAALVIASLLLALWIDSTILNGVIAGVFLFQSVVSVEALRYLGRLNQPGVDALLTEDPRPPILFLRSFALDELPVSPVDDGWRGAIDMLSVVRRTFEERLRSAFDDIGPLIAIGRPGEDVAPIGAAREYVGNASWQQLVLERADAAQLVLMELDATPGMEWELDSVSKRVGLQRIAIVLPPGKDIHDERSQEWYERWALLRDRFSFLPEVTNDTVAVLFDRDDRPILVSARSSSVEKQLAALKTAWQKSAPLGLP